MIRTGSWVKCLLSTTEGSAKTSPTQCRLRNVEWSHEHRRLRSPESLRSSNLGRDHLPPMRQKATLNFRYVAIPTPRHFYLLSHQARRSPVFALSGRTVGSPA
jgi:hypothetical protein